MGLFKNYVNKPLTSPKTPIVAVDNRFAFQQPVTLLLKEKILSFSGDDFSITDVRGTPYFKCNGKAFNIKEKKVIYDLYNKPVLSIKNKFFSISNKQTIYDGSGNQVIARVEPQGIILNKKYFVYYKNLVTGKDDYIEMKCDLIGSTCGIYHGREKEGAPLICKIHKKLDAKLVFTSQENYYIEIAAGVDASFMVALAICFDEFKNEKDRD